MDPYEYQMNIFCTPLHTLTDDKPKISSLTFSSFWCPAQGTAPSPAPCCPLINASCSLLNSPRMFCEMTYLVNELTIWHDSFQLYIMLYCFLDFISSFVHCWIQKRAKCFCALCNFCCYWKILRNHKLIKLLGTEGIVSRNEVNGDTLKPNKVGLFSLSMLFSVCVHWIVSFVCMILVKFTFIHYSSVSRICEWWK